MRKVEKRTTTEPDRKIYAIALRSAGFSTLAISERIGVSVRTLHRWFSASATTKGELKQSLIEEAKEELLSKIKSDEAVRQEIAVLLVDELAHANALKQKMHEALELLKPTNLQEAALALRASASYATSLKALSDTVRASIKLEKSTPNYLGDDIPELHVSELALEEIQSITDSSVESYNEEEEDSELDNEILTSDDV